MISTSILVGAAAIAGAIYLGARGSETARFQIGVADNLMTWRLDTVTGELIAWPINRGFPGEFAGQREWRYLLARTDPRPPSCCSNGRVTKGEPPGQSAKRRSAVTRSAQARRTRNVSRL